MTSAAEFYTFTAENQQHKKITSAAEFLLLSTDFKQISSFPTSFWNANCNGRLQNLSVFVVNAEKNEARCI